MMHFDAIIRFFKKFSASFDASYDQNRLKWFSTQLVPFSNGLLKSKKILKKFILTFKSCSSPIIMWMTLRYFYTGGYVL
jgi:hypothetical protein